MVTVALMLGALERRAEDELSFDLSNCAGMFVAAQSLALWA